MGSAASAEAKEPWAREDNTLNGPWTFKMKENVQCLCEGARYCTRENPARQKTSPPFAGLHADWVGEQCLAMARPWQTLVLHHKVVEQFLKNNIGMVLNLEEPGEHANCGPGNLRGGFTYDAETFMAKQIGVYNFCWRDMGVPNISRMMDIVQVMDHVTATEGRKVAVHCHAGLGRTGLAIACFFVYTRQYKAADAIAAVRAHRPGSVQTSEQVLFVTIFEQFLQYLRCVVPWKGARMLGPAAAAPPPAPPPPPQQQPSPPQAQGANAANVPNVAAGSAAQDVPKEVQVAGGVRTETYHSGLVIVKPTGARTQEPGSTAAPVAVSVPLAPAFDDVAYSQLPWTDAFLIRKELFHSVFIPPPPETYHDALRRQQRLLHGVERRSLLYMHKLVKEVSLAIIASARTLSGDPPPLSPSPAAGRSSSSNNRGKDASPRPASASRTSATPPLSAHQPQQSQQARPSSSSSRPSTPQASRQSLQASPPPPPAPPPAGPPPAPSGNSRPTTPQHNNISGGTPQQGQYSNSGTPIGRPTTPNGRPTTPQSRPGTPGTPSSGRKPVLGGALSFAHVAAAVVAGEKVDGKCPPPLQQAFFGVEAGPWESRASGWDGKLRTAANAADYSTGAGRLAVAPVAALLKLLTDFFQQFASPSLTEPGLQHIGAVYQALPIVRTADPEKQQYNDAWQVLRVLHTADQELLLMFASLLRHVSRAAGVGCEAPTALLSRWVARCLLRMPGPTPPAGAPTAPEEEALMTFLYYLLMNDVGFATLVLFVQTRLQGKRNVDNAMYSTRPDQPGARMAQISVTSVTSSEGGGSGSASPSAVIATTPKGAESSRGVRSQQQVKDLVGQDVSSLYYPPAPPPPSKQTPLKQKLADARTAVMPPQQQRDQAVHDVFV